MVQGKPAMSALNVACVRQNALKSLK